MKKKTGKLRVGVIGVGYLGRYHAEKFAGMQAVELAGVVDVDKAQSEEIAERFHTRAFQDYADLFGRVDAVSIVTPTPQHFSIAKDFLKQDIDVMIEKPITTAVDLADELIHLAKSRGRLIQVGHLERFNPAFVSLTGLIHNPRLIESRRVSTYKTRGTDVSVVLDLMIHDIDLVLSLVQSEIRDVKAAGMTMASDHLDVASARIEFANGCVANVSASRIAPVNERKMDIYQQNAHIFIDFANQKTAILKKGNTVPGANVLEVEADTCSRVKGDALRDELMSFVRCVNTREAPAVNGEMGRDALRTALDIEGRIMNIHYRMSIDEGR